MAKSVGAVLGHWQLHACSADLHKIRALNFLASACYSADVQRLLTELVQAPVIPRWLQRLLTLLQSEEQFLFTGPEHLIQEEGRVFYALFRPVLKSALDASFTAESDGTLHASFAKP